MPFDLGVHRKVYEDMKDAAKKMRGDELRNLYGPKGVTISIAVQPDEMEEAAEGEGLPPEDEETTDETETEEDTEEGV